MCRAGSAAGSTASLPAARRRCARWCRVRACGRCLSGAAVPGSVSRGVTTSLCGRTHRLGGPLRGDCSNTWHEAQSRSGQGLGQPGKPAGWTPRRHGARRDRPGPPCRVPGPNRTESCRTPRRLGYPVNRVRRTKSRGGKHATCSALGQCWALYLVQLACNMARRSKKANGCNRWLLGRSKIPRLPLTPKDQVFDHACIVQGEDASAVRGVCLIALVAEGTAT